MKKAEMTVDYSPLSWFAKYLEILYAKDDLWEEFQHYVREIEPNRDADFFAYNRDPECVEAWRQMLENMGGGFPLIFFASASFLLLRYKEAGHDLDVELERIHEKSGQLVKCPICGSYDVAPILYGMPAYDEELEAKEKNHDVFLGGCAVEKNAATYHCYKCKKGIATPPFLNSKHGEEDFRNIVTSVQFSYDMGFGESDVVLIKKTPRGYTLNAKGSIDSTAVKDRDLSESEWQDVLSTLFCTCYVHEWREQYSDHTRGRDIKWTLDIQMSNQRSRKYHGENAFPPYWSELHGLFAKYIEEAEREIVYDE